MAHTIIGVGIWNVGLYMAWLQSGANGIMLFTCSAVVAFVMGHKAATS